MSDKPAERHILHATAKEGTKVHTWIVGIFANEKMLRTHAASVRLAYASKAPEMIKAFDPNAHVDTAGKYFETVKLTASIAPYNLVPALPDDEPVLTPVG